MKSYRRAYHCGSWYSKDKEKLAKSFQDLYDRSTSSPSNAKAAISPHAGYAYSLQTIIQVYGNVNFDNIKNVFILGPNHHIYNKGFLFPKVDRYETPFGFLEINKEIIADIMKNDPDDLYNYIDPLDDEEEHSIEMQLPVLKYLTMDNIRIIPIYVGCIGNNIEAIKRFCEPLRKYFKDNSNLFIVSSDFCHYGIRFNFTKISKKYNDTHIFKQIENMDIDGINIIGSHNAAAFIEYLTKTHNTICGSNPIKILLMLLQEYPGNICTRLVDYRQSSPVIHLTDSSVSYAGIVSTID